MNLSKSKPNKQSSIDCTCEDPITCLQKMFVDMVQKGRVRNGQCPVERPVFRKIHGTVKGKIVFETAIPEEFKQGIFSHAGESFDTYLHYSSDTQPSSADFKSTIGLGLKIFGMPGEKVVSDDGANTADLIFQNSPNFFVDDARGMCSFTKASLEGKDAYFIEKNFPGTTEILETMKRKESSILTTKLWSVLPFKLGDNFCKYILLPNSTTSGKTPDYEDTDYLQKDLAERLAAGEETLELYIQVRPSDISPDYLAERYPLDKAMTIWDEEEAKPIKVATIVLPQQNIIDEAQQKYGNWLSFNIGRVPAENEPVGSIAAARIQIYQASAQYRKTMNKQPVAEPTGLGVPKIEDPVCRSLSAEQLKAIVTVKVHPGIGVGRLGGSDEYYLGPEEFTPKLTEAEDMRDDAGLIKRQAVRYRVYGYDAAGNMVAEIQESLNSSIEWSVHLANKKAAWFEFRAAMDIPSMKNTTINLRNPSVSGKDREKLVIDAGEKGISGVNKSGREYEMSGWYMHEKIKKEENQNTQTAKEKEYEKRAVYLGELRTEETGRLVVLPARGISESPSNQPPFVRGEDFSFSNGKDWYDDIADGPVRATVTIGDKKMEAVSGWFASAPPNYAPDVISWRTMNDLMQHLFIEAGQIKLPNVISFNHHVKPILQRMTDLQWVNKGFSAMFGVDGPMNFNDPKLLEKLSSVIGNSKNKDVYQELRRSILNSFRSNTSTSLEKYAWPGIYGDEFGELQDYENSPGIYLNLPPVYAYILRQWVAGNFVTDAEIRLSEPEILDQSAMHFCIADAFHPGAELTWPMRHISMYDAPYRIKTRPKDAPEPNYGARLSSTAALQIGGPLYEQGPGDLTKWMALPWQGDTAFCRSGYESSFDPYVPTYWPARVPNQVLAIEDYETLCDETKTDEERLAAFHNRAAWMRTIPQTLGVADQMLSMIENYQKMGIVAAKPRPKGEAWDWLPETLFVENRIVAASRGLLLSAKEQQAQVEQEETLAKTGWINDAQREEMYNIRRRK